MHTSEVMQDARRDMEICNACRYCEGFCAVFPAMELRREFSTAISLISRISARLPRLLLRLPICAAASVRRQRAEPSPKLRQRILCRVCVASPARGLFSARNGLIVSLATAIGIAVVLILTMLLKPADVLYGSHARPGRILRRHPLGRAGAVRRGHVRVFDCGPGHGRAEFLARYR